MQTDEGCMEPINTNNPEQLELAKRNPDLVFRVGERVQVKGGDFKIKSFGKKMMVLEGLPGTRLKK